MVVRRRKKYRERRQFGHYHDGPCVMSKGHCLLYARAYSKWRREDPEYCEELREYQRLRYAVEGSYRNHKIEQRKQRQPVQNERRRTPESRASRREKLRKKYANDPEYRARKIAASREYRRAKRAET